MKFLSDSGKVFDTAEECINYERKYDSNRKSRIEKIRNVSDKLDELVLNYAHEYPLSFLEDLDFLICDDDDDDDDDLEDDEF